MVYDITYHSFTLEISNRLNVFYFCSFVFICLEG